MMLHSCDAYLPLQEEHLSARAADAPPASSAHRASHQTILDAASHDCDRMRTSLMAEGAPQKRARSGTRVEDMMMDDQLYGRFILSERDTLLDACAQEYRDRCDAYDARVCTGISPRTGAPVPVTSYEYVMVNRHALDVLTDLALHYPFSRDEIRHAITHH
jgi:hypothetical protein